MKATIRRIDTAEIRQAFTVGELFARTYDMALEHLADNGKKSVATTVEKMMSGNYEERVIAGTFLNSYSNDFLEVRYWE